MGTMYDSLQKYDDSLYKVSRDSLWQKSEGNYIQSILFFKVVMFYKVAGNSELMDSEPLVLRYIQS